MVANENIHAIQERLKHCVELLKHYSFITEMFIIEYFTENHWKKLPMLWQDTLCNMKIEEISDFLSKDFQKSCNKVWPLSFLAFLKCTKVLQLPRNKKSKEAQEKKDDHDFKHMFYKHVNPKKQHEIMALSKVIAKVYKHASCQCVIDLGSGQGHLSRVLSLGLGFPVFALEHEEIFSQKAQKFDEEAKLHFKKQIKRNKRSEIELLSPNHIICTISPDCRATQLLQEIKNKSSLKEKESVTCSSPKRCLVTGLHACGDLSATMLRLFKESDDICALVSVACCYMKLTTDVDETKPLRICETARNSYPMSEFTKSLPSHELCYKARELACHAIEDYSIRLKENGPHLKMHCYRAVLEFLIRKHHPHLVRPGVQTVKKAYLLPFKEYVEKAFDKLKLPQLQEALVTNDEIEKMLNEWKKVVVLFSLCLIIAPVIETVILLDRMVYLSENGNCK